MEKSMVTTIEAPIEFPPPCKAGAAKHREPQPDGRTTKRRVLRRRSGGLALWT